MVYETMSQMRDALSSAGVTADSDPALLRDRLIDALIRTAVFSGDDETRNEARRLIHHFARRQGAVPASILPLYEAIGRGEVTRQFTVPAHNIRALTYDLSRAIFRAAGKLDAGAFIFEIARSEIGYTEQRPGEYAACVLAAAIKEGWTGPVFIQGDHFQASARRWFGSEREKEQKALESLIDEAIAAEFYNIDIDTSTLVDLSYPTVDEQQRANYEGTAHFTKYIRERQPDGIEISVGGEIGEVGKHNTSPEEFRAYISGFLKLLPEGMKGVQKVSIQTGTSHGGVPLADGSIAEAKIDFGTLRAISKIAREEYGISGAVQHGASTLPEEVFDNFPKNDTVEIHLATGFQNMIYDHPRFPADLLEQTRRWCDANCADEKKDGETEEQFFYKSRKKALGPFKRQFWDIPDADRNAIVADLEDKFSFLMKKLGVDGTRSLVNEWITTDRQRPEFSGSEQLQPISALVVEGEGE